MPRSLRVLIVEDSTDDATLTIRAMQKGGLDPTSERVDTPEAMTAALETGTWDIVVADYSMPHFSAPAALAMVRTTGKDIPVIVVSGTMGEDTAVAAMRLGAQDYLLKSNLARLAPAVERELRERDSRQARRDVEDKLLRERALAEEARTRAQEALASTEEQLRQAQKMEAVGRLAGGVAHDFNNLLSVVLSYTDLILSDLKGDDPLREDLEEILKAGKRATDLTRQLLAFSRQQVLEPKVLELNASVSGMQKMLERLLGADVEVILLLASGLGRVRVDPGQIEQILMNLAVNARDAMPNGGKLTLETRNVDASEIAVTDPLGVTPCPHVMLGVSDTGIGMDKDTLTRIFEPFFTTKGKGRGTGLGLSTVFGIVKQSGGHLVVESEPGQGASFKVYFPRSEAAEDVALSEPPVAPSVRGTETILLVENDDQVRGVAKSILRKTGYTVLEASGAGEALLVSEQYDRDVHLLLTDVALPHMSGVQLGHRLCGVRPAMKVLLMSGYTDEITGQQGIPASGLPYLQKPILPGVLALKVREVLGHWRA